MKAFTDQIPNQELGETMAEITGSPDAETELKNLKDYFRDYNATITAKMDALEDNLTAFEEENARLRGLKDSFSVERDACVGLIAQLAKHAGYKVGKVGENTVAVELPSGQVSWEYAPSEAHLFEALPAYEGEIEGLDIVEKYRRVMNPGINS